MSKVIKPNDIKKGWNLKTKQLGAITSAIMVDSKKGTTRLVDVKGSEVGLFDEIGSIYVWDIVEAQDPKTGEWYKVDSSTYKAAQSEVLDFFGKGGF